MLVRVLAVALYLSVRLSVTRRCSIKSDGQSDLVFGMEASVDQSVINSGIYK